MDWSFPPGPEDKSCDAEEEPHVGGGHPVVLGQRRHLTSTARHHWRKGVWPWGGLVAGLDERRLREQGLAAARAPTQRCCCRRWLGGQQPTLIAKFHLSLNATVALPS